MNEDGNGTDKGYEIAGVAVWYHPYRYDAWHALGDVQRANLRQRVREKLQAAETPDLEAATEKLYKTLEYEDRRKRGNDYLPIFLRGIRKHHVENGGMVFDMSEIGPHLEATWSDGITLRNVLPRRSGIYVHVGETIEYDTTNPASLIEGFYITHTDGPVRGWLFTFVTNYAEWEQREHHLPGHTRANFNRFIAFTIPEDADIAKLDYKNLEIIGDKVIAKDASGWHLARLATNAMLYLSRSLPDLHKTMSMFRVETTETQRSEIYECGCEEIDWNIDWSNATLTPGRWIIEEPGDNGSYMMTRWIPPKVVRPQEREKFLRDGGKVLAFKVRKVETL